MLIQDQVSWNDLDGDWLDFFKALGVDTIHVETRQSVAVQDQKVNLFDSDRRTELFEQAREKVEAKGMKLNNVFFSCPREIPLGLEDADDKIEGWIGLLESLGQAGIPALGWNFKPMGNFRTDSASGRGGVSYSTFDYEEWERTKGAWPDKQIDEEGMWANITYFLERVIPVAEECGVRMALHPDDPPIAEAMGGAARIVSTLEQYERIFSLQPSDAHAMLFCQGCVTEMGVDVLAAIRRMAAQNKIVYVHFRNVKGARKYFEEVFVDEGDVDMLQAMQTYKDAGFNGPFMMDHTPQIPGDVEGARAGHALATGYIRAMIQVVYGDHS